MGESSDTEFITPQERKIPPDVSTALEQIVHLDHIAQNNEIYSRLASNKITLQQAKQLHESLLVEVASIDHLTGLDNARAALIKLDALMKYCQDNNIDLTVLYLDGDDFKLINDTFGHDVGDRVIRALAQAIEQATRNSDLPVRINAENSPNPLNEATTEPNKKAARQGGDEFALGLPGTNLKNTGIVYNRINKIFAHLTNRDIPEFKQKFGRSMTVTGGAAEYIPGVDNNPKGLLQRSETAMRFAKEQTKGNLAYSSYEARSGRAEYRLAYQGIGDANNPSAWGFE